MDLEMVRGDSPSWAVTLMDADNNAPLDLTGKHLQFAVKRQTRDPDSKALCILTEGSGIEVTDAVNGQCKVTIPPDATSGLAPMADALDYVWDFQVSWPPAVVKTPLRGVLHIAPDTGIAANTGLARYR